MTEPVIRSEHLSKRYRVGGAPRRHGDFREAFDNLLKAPLRRLRSTRIEPTQEDETFWAIKDLSFEVAPG